MTVTEKVAYLKGLAQGLGLDADNKQDKLIAAIIDVLDDMALSVADLEAGLDELGEQVDDIDEDLAAVEEDLYEDEDGCSCGCDHDDCGCCADDFIEVKCPQCGETIASIPILWKMRTASFVPTAKPIWSLILAMSRSRKRNNYSTAFVGNPAGHV